MSFNSSSQSIRDIAQGVRDGAISPDQPARQALQRIGQGDGSLRAWVFAADSDQVASQAARQSGTGLLAGVPFGVKDIINVEGMPTRCGSLAHHDDPVQFDAACVSLLRAAGAVPVGKTVTAEFAYVTPGPTRNPVNAEHTPGGSSSGSAAAVAVGMVPFALGTQTGGSVIRPSAFCGVVGFKPTYGSVHRDGMKLTCDSLDTIGWHARSIEDAAMVAAVLLSREQHTTETRVLSDLKVAYMPSIPEHTPEADAGNALEAARTALQDSGIRVDTVPPLPLFKTLLQAHAVIMAYEFARSLAPVARGHARVLSKPLLEIVERGLKAPASQYVDMKQLQAECRTQWSAHFADADLILTPGAPGPAPHGLLTTGSSVFNRNWTLLGWPCLQMPTGIARNGLPLGVQLVGKPDADMQLLYWGSKLHALIQRA